MIYQVPKNKIVNYKYKQLNENIFDDFADDENMVYDDTLLGIISEESIPKVKAFLDYNDVYNYEIYTEGLDILVDVHNHLFLPNRKLSNIKFSFIFNTVDGNVNFSGNNLTDWSLFPRHIKGNCYASFNKIKSFDGAPVVDGLMVADKQKTKTIYPLTQSNYEKVMHGQIVENMVYSLKYNKFGYLENINESTNECIVKCEDNKVRTCKLNEVEYIGNIDKLFV